MALIDLLIQTNMRDESSECSNFMIFEYGIYARIPLQDKLSELKMPVQFMYGETCILDRSVPTKLLELGDL